MTREQKQDFTRRISQANPTDMVVILYEMLICYVQDGRNAMERQEDEEVHESLRKAGGCLGELMNSLDLRYEPAPALLGLCGYCVRMLTIAELRKSQEPLCEVEQIAGRLRDAFFQVAGQNKSGSVMNNSQTVYAGLTYGRNTLTENVTDQGANRGMYA